MEALTKKLEAFMEHMTSRQQALEKQMVDLSIAVRGISKKPTNGDIEGHHSGAQPSNHVAGIDKRSSSTRFVKRLTQEKMVKRRSKGLCYNYDESYSKRHKRKRLFWIRISVVEDGSADNWYNCSIRSIHHDGRIKASSSCITFLNQYVGQRQVINKMSDDTLHLDLYYVVELRVLKTEQDSHLKIGSFRSEVAIVCLAKKEVEKIDVYAEEEVEYGLRRMVGEVEECVLNSGLLQGSARIVRWQTPFYEFKNMEELPVSYSDFKKLKLSPTTPLASPDLPKLDIGLEWGTLPTLDDVNRYMDTNPWKPNENWTVMKAVSAAKSIRKKQSGQLEMSNVLVNAGASNQMNSNSKEAVKNKLRNSFFVSMNGNAVGGGTNVALDALAAYLRYFEGTPRDDWQELHDKLRIAESRTGAAFYPLFGPALSLGIISRRMVHYEAVKYEKERNGGFLSPLGYSASTVAAAVDAVCSMEWYLLLASRSQKCIEQSHSIRIWKWNGHLIQYTVVGHEGPAVLLVHGFGAFLEHYRDNMNAIADAGNRVWSITLIGFGRSEKPNLVYTELLWAELVRDFIADVVGEPAHLVGNSIGGFFVSIAAGLWPSSAKSLILVNPAGLIISERSFPLIEVRSERPTSGATWLGSRLLMLFLRSIVENIVKNFYPINPERADNLLINEMLRASYDPGALAVLESIFSFDLSIPLNFLFQSFGGKVLIIQGTKDPLSKSIPRLSMFREYCKGITIKELDAGHCPHDERPQEVNSFICEWIEAMERKLQTC
ncbi:hypothetical protein Scep_006713 [Stephania cephalantha]|uniref:AB hydrolase-1 domain-containing protein n=1 Tax=Stephania cephalantha TaxID=152367 RepID=A0AAP0PPB1_9MAGN